MKSDELGYNSAVPMKGSYRIECFDTNNESRMTGAIELDESPAEVQKHIIEKCPWLRDNMTVLQGPLDLKPSDGRSFTLKFSGVKGTLLPFKVHSDES